MTGEISIIKIDGLTEPAKVLINRIYGALGGYFKPYQIRRVGKADAEVQILQAQTQIEITELQRRAMTRWVAEELQKQENIEKIAEKAIPMLESSSHPENVENDWIVNFFDKCRIISDEEMQILWAKVLAGEANSPGRFSKRTVNLLGSLDKADAQLFTTLCSFGWFCLGFSPLIYDEKALIYKDQGLDFDQLAHLDDIGLISFSSMLGFSNAELPQHIVTRYQGKSLIIDFNKPEKNQLEVGKVILTKTGLQLARICETRLIDGFYDYVVEIWAKRGLALSEPIS